jgi:hypothetical protein
MLAKAEDKNDLLEHIISSDKCIYILMVMSMHIMFMRGAQRSHTSA